MTGTPMGAQSQYNPISELCCDICPSINSNQPPENISSLLPEQTSDVDSNNPGLGAAELIEEMEDNNTQLASRSV